MPFFYHDRNWKEEGERKLDIRGETRYCDPQVLQNILSCKTIFDKLEAEELVKARTRSNPFETIRSGFFLNRAAMKMANMDAVFGFMFTNPVDENGRSLGKEPFDVNHIIFIVQVYNTSTTRNTDFTETFIFYITILIFYR
jgi:cap1 methyltransferase